MRNTTSLINQLNEYKTQMQKYHDRMCKERGGYEMVTSNTNLITFTQRQIETISDIIVQLDTDDNKKAAL